MKAWQYSKTTGGLPKNLTLNQDVAKPRVGPEQILVKVKSIALNPVDYKPAEVALLHRLAFPKPATPGIDFVGTVVTAPADTKLSEGQTVFGLGTSHFFGGMLAEYAVTEKKSTMALADSVDEIFACSTGVAALTAYQSVIKASQAPRAPGTGKRIFINGGSGGTGVFGIQFAKALGHDVTVTCSTRNVELCQSLGAEVIDYTKGSVLETLKDSAQSKPYDLVVDNVFDPTLYWGAHEYTTSDASFLVIAGSPSLHFASEMLKMKLLPGWLGGGKRRIELLFASTGEPEQLAQFQQWYLEKKVRAVIDSRFAFEEAPQAFEKLKTGRAVGKIIIDVGT